MFLVYLVHIVHWWSWRVVINNMIGVHWTFHLNWAIFIYIFHSFTLIMWLSFILCNIIFFFDYRTSSIGITLLLFIIFNSRWSLARCKISFLLGWFFLALLTSDLWLLIALIFLSLHHWIHPEGIIENHNYWLLYSLGWHLRRSQTIINNSSIWLLLVFVCRCWLH